ncbi:hypothetical protein [Bacillus changyiensis]|uniref:hypothetical protein n=1 Tax=Bacillus changyiensis TaxID=3004103 RepID=UPI0022E3C8EC|nr:hypothetical protein [Bacillus changyiensis]MDA1477463.1 hypothetical protein [Bacillus changyiensis]
MKKSSILLPCLLLAISIYAFLRSEQASLFTGQKEWFVLVALIGLAFLYQGKKEADSTHFFAGSLMTAIGIYFILKKQLFIHIDDFTAIVLIFGVTLLFKSFREKQYQLESLLLIAIALYLYFYRQITDWLQTMKPETTYIGIYWPFALAAVSLFLLLIKRK